ncbi:MAG: TIGR00289 family protein [Candidatus Aenigmarchaeota archaeon]|nr:TIGR00289 family protein [Candidatus Aenigmarchaeota archaeon]
MKKKRFAALISGGKDSIFAVHKAIESGMEPFCLIAIYPKRDDSYMFHHPNVHLTSLQAEAIGIKLIKKETDAEKEEELSDLEDVLSVVAEDVDAVVTGAFFSNYQKERIDKICEKLGLESAAPLWQKDAEKTITEMVESGFKIIITKVAAEGLGEEWLGREIDRDAIDELVELNRKHKISIVGEGGEFETLVLDSPLFEKRIEIVSAKKKMEGLVGTYLIDKAVLVDKD